MRLTLRTLLAYLDDRLPPANARELGQKIVKSPFATDLADRIKSVVRRRRLATDSADQKNIDANLIAEYLDDQLTPELVALIEKEILGSDQTLAEVAAAHQILGLLSDPAEISEELSGRLYKLDPFAESTADDASTISQSEGAGDWQPLAPQSTASRRSPMLLLLLMVVGWLALLFTDPYLFGKGGASTDSSPESVVAVDNNVAAADGRQNKTTPSSATAGTELTQNNAPESSVPDAAAVTEKENASSETAAVASKNSTNNAEPTGDGIPPTTAVPAASPGGSTVASVGPNEANMKTDASTTPPEPAAEPEATPPPADTVVPAPALVFEVRDVNRMHMVHEGVDEGWKWAVAADADPVNNWGERLVTGISAISEPFRVKVVGAEAGWSATVAGSSLFRAVDENASGIELFEGRLVLERTGQEKPQEFALVANGWALSIAVPGVDDKVGVSVIPLPASVPPAERSDDLALFPFGGPSIVTVFAADNAVSIKFDGTDQPVVIPRGKALQWHTGQDLPDAKAAAGPQLIPEWVYKTTLRLPDSTQSLLEEAASGFRSEPTVVAGATAVSGNRNPQLAAYGVRLTALTRDVDQLTSYLLQPNEEVVRQEAIMGLRTIIQQSDVGSDRVTSSLETRLSNAELDNAMKMLAGVSRTSAEDRFVSRWLVEMLESNRVALREMAIVNLEELTSERNGFFADGDAGRRGSAVRRWERFLERNDGRLVKPAE